MISTRIVPVLAGLPLFSAPASDALLLQSCEILKRKSYSVLSLFIQQFTDKRERKTYIFKVIRFLQRFIFSLHICYKSCVPQRTLFKIWCLFITMIITIVTFKIACSIFDLSSLFSPLKGCCKMALLPPVVNVMYSRSRSSCRECIFGRD